MWTCTKCGRIFEKNEQPHSCRKIPLEEHFKNKEKAKLLFDYLVGQIEDKIGECKIISLPCCIHMFGRNDFLAALPKKNKLEIRFGLKRRLDTTRLKQSVSVSAKIFKNCIDLLKKKDIDGKLIAWLRESYHLKDNLSVKL